MDLGKKPQVMHFAEGDYVMDASRQYASGPFDDAGAELAKYEAEIAKKKLEKEEKFKRMKKSDEEMRPIAVITDEDVVDIEAYLSTLI